MAIFQTEPASRHTILVVDHDPAGLDNLAHILRLEGHEVLTATHGQQAIELCHSYDIHLMLLELRLTDMSGEEVVRQVRGFERDVQILLNTRNSTYPPRRLLRELDVQGYHDKSDGLEKLLLWVDAALKTYRHTQIRHTLDGSLLALGLALEARDLETAGHTRRVASLAITLGWATGLRGRELQGLRQGAYLHDLGKLAVPDSVLLKPGKLDAEEWVIMQSHTVKGYDLATQIPGLAQGTLEVVRSHHERWDGSGYPDRLSRESIPLEARIFALCDVYDALTSERPYKRAWPHQQAIDEIGHHSGSHFDPEIAEVFLQVAQSDALVRVSA